MTLPTRHWDRRDTGGLTFTELGMGTAPLGNLYRAISDDEAHATLQAAWDGGVRYYDTAPLYGFGLAETRLNRFLRDKPRDEYVLSSKVGRLLRPATETTRDGIGKWFDVPARREVYDYSYDGVMRSVEFSLERLGVDRIDILFAHDIDVPNQGSRANVDAKVDQLMAGGYHALERLRLDGTIAAFGAGVNEWEVCETLLHRGDFDMFLLAGRYTLLGAGGADILPAALRSTRRRHRHRRGLQFRHPRHRSGRGFVVRLRARRPGGSRPRRPDRGDLHGPRHPPDRRRLPLPAPASLHRVGGPRRSGPGRVGEQPAGGGGGGACGSLGGVEGGRVGAGGCAGLSLGDGTTPITITCVHSSPVVDEISGLSSVCIFMCDP